MEQVREPGAAHLTVAGAFPPLAKNGYVYDLTHSRQSPALSASKEERKLKTKESQLRAARE